MKLGTPEILLILVFILFIVLIPIGLYRLGFKHGKAVGAKEALEKQVESQRK